MCTPILRIPEFLPVPYSTRLAPTGFKRAILRYLAGEQHPLGVPVKCMELCSSFEYEKAYDEQPLQLATVGVDFFGKPFDYVFATLNRRKWFTQRITLFHEQHSVLAYSGQSLNVDSVIPCSSVAYALGVRKEYLLRYMRAAHKQSELAHFVAVWFRPFGL